MLAADSPRQVQEEISVLHIVLPPLAVPIGSGGDAAELGDHIITALWNVFSCVRESYNTFKHQKTVPSFLIWSWPGESSDRPSMPTSPASLSNQGEDSLSLLPALSGLLRCMALELDRSITLITTDAKPNASEVRDLVGFLDDQAVQIGDLNLSNHQLFSFEPRLVSSLGSQEGDEAGHLFDGHVLSLGGARGIVAEMLNRLTTNQTHLSLVGRTSLEKPDKDFEGLSAQEMMRLLISKNREASNPLVSTPKLLQSEVDKIQRQFALQAHLKDLKAGVKRFDYHSVDLADAGGFKSLIQDELMNDTEVLISGAGVIRDQSCLTKTKDSFEAVLRTKVMPLCVLLCHGLPSSLRTWISFSSIASKSGNPGQTDYAAANEFLNTVIHWFSRRHPEIRLRTINWGPWQGSGMASPEVLKAFHSRGLEAIYPEDAAGLLRGIFDSDWNPVEVSGVALDPSVTLRLQQQQLLLESSTLWNHHSVPVQDALASDELRLLFHESVPYLSGHKKNGRAVVPAALVLCLAADLASSSNNDNAQCVQLDLYVYNGIIIPECKSVNVYAQSKVLDGGRAGEILLRAFKQNRPHYKVGWQLTNVDAGISDYQWQFDPNLNNDSLLYCDINEVYDSCLFHSGVMARLCGCVVIDPSIASSWCRAQATPLQEQLGIDVNEVEQPLPNRDLTLVDSLFQLLLVQTIETYGTSALPQELSITMFEPMPQSGEVKLTAKILDVQESVITAVGACCDLQGRIIFIMKPSKFTTSKDLLDHPPGISRRQRIGSL